MGEGKYTVDTKILVFLKTYFNNILQLKPTVFYGGPVNIRVELLELKSVEYTFDEKYPASRYSR